MKGRSYRTRDGERIVQRITGHHGPTCRCSMCGRKDASKKNTSRHLYIENGINRDESDRSWDALNGDQERRLLRRRCKQNMTKMMEDGWE